ncbi:alpha/beta hydrolase [Antrihabitans stalactiti]|uniref:alpha/beta hydrolase n=1 Tax=Antrihabitans stalactiti TaxID=2584121 RepID=UPI0030B8161B
MRTTLSVLSAEPIPPGTSMPGTTIVSEHKLTLTRYGRRPTSKPPVLLVPPPAAPAATYDLRPTQSLVAHLVDQGHAVYLADYGDISYADRGMGFEEWIDRIVPRAVSAASAEAAQSVHIVGWSLGGTLSLLTVAAHPGLPVASIATIGTPIDYSKLPAISPLRRAATVTGGRVIGTVNRVMGGVPPWLVRNSFKLTALERELTKPWFVLQHANETVKLEQMKSVDGFMAAMPAYPGRLFHQMWHQLMLGNELANGHVVLGDRRIDLGEIRVPVLAVAGLADVIAPVPVAHAITTVLTGAPRLRFETAPGGHVGVLAGPKAPTTTWRFLDEHLAG